MMNRPPSSSDDGSAPPPSVSPGSEGGVPNSEAPTGAQTGSGTIRPPSSFPPGPAPASVPPPTPLSFPPGRGASSKSDAPEALIEALDSNAPGWRESDARWESPRPTADVIEDFDVDSDSAASELSAVFGGLARAEGGGLVAPTPPDSLPRSLPARPRSVPPPPPSKRLQPLTPHGWAPDDDGELPTQTASATPPPPNPRGTAAGTATNTVAAQFLPPPPPVPQVPNASMAAPSVPAPPPPPPPEEDDEEEVVTRIMGAPAEAPRSLAPLSRAASLPGALRDHPWVTRWLARPPAPALAAAAAGGLLVALLAWIASPEQGELVVDVSNQTCGVVEDVKIFVDDKLVCEQSPCRITTDSDSHVVRAVAEGYGELAPNAVRVQPGSVTLHKLQLGPREDTGVKVASPVPGLTLYLDGKEVGPLPQTITGLSAGEHRLRIEGDPRYLPEERTLTLEPGQMVLLEDLQPKRRPGVLKIGRSERLRDATIKLDGERVSLPLKRELDPERRYHLVVERSGYEPYEKWIDFRNGDLEKVLDIHLQPEEESSTGRARAPRRSRQRARPAAAKQTASANRATLNLNSIPVTTVLLNGRPLGQTPKVGVTVNPGTHTVVFMHPERGRKRGSATVKAGETKTVVVRFD